MRIQSTLPEATENLIRQTIGCAIAVHRELGPGYVEPIYRHAMCVELDIQGISFKTEEPVAVFYRGRGVGGQRVDLIVDERIVVELKAVRSFEPIHEAQILSYLKATGFRAGLLINFNVRILKEGIRRLVL